MDNKRPHPKEFYQMITGPSITLGKEANDSTIIVPQASPKPRNTWASVRGSIKI